MLGVDGLPFTSGGVSGVVLDLLGLLTSHRRGPDSLVFGVPRDDEETTLEWRRESDDTREGEGEGVEGVDGLGAVVGRDRLHLPRTEGEGEGGDNAALISRSRDRGSSYRGERRPDPDEGGPLSSVEYPVRTCVSVC